ncbi:MAG TPA: TIR domain-containing protein [Phenylobacterium sp.]|uniref:TIR domain-containing protein n=1 Tax=Phenylobacterium sp. TaxID=1871053 RepID=UPI002F92E5BF
MSELLDRLEGPENRARLLEAIARQDLVGGDESLAEAFAGAGKLEKIAANEVLITQGDYDDDLFLILAGEFEVSVNGQVVSHRAATTQVGEQAGVDVAQARTATVRACMPSVVLRLPQNAIEAAAGDNAKFWRRMNRVLGQRLEERNRKLGHTNEIPRLFVISSKEGLPVAEQLQVLLNSDEIAVDIWDQGTFGVSDYPISSLMDRISAADFTVAIVRDDDVLISRGETTKAPRDNVNLEYGISLGLLNRRRSILLVCADEKVKLASDLTGLTTYRYSHKNADAMKRSIRSVSIQLKEHIQLEGVFQDRRAE